MRRGIIPVAAIAVAALNGCDKGGLTEPERAPSGRAATEAGALPGDLREVAGTSSLKIAAADVQGLVGGFLPIGDTPLNGTLRKQLAQGTVDAAGVREAIHSLETTTGWDHDPELVALHLTLEAALRSLTGADQSNAKSNIQ